MRRLALVLAFSAVSWACGGKDALPARDSGAGPADGTADVTACESDVICDDGLFCNGEERCVSGVCVAGTAVACDDGVTCTRDRCDEASSGCAAMPDDSLCGDVERCHPARGCVRQTCDTDRDCSDGTVCDGEETCVSHTCMDGIALACDDGIACTRDECDATQGCSHTADDALCDDARYCNGAERCVAQTGCLPGAPPVCSDGVTCSNDRCDEALRACVREPRDLDGDGHRDGACGGSDCNDRSAAIHAGASEICNDGIDNDCNLRVDCADSACHGSAICAMCMRQNVTEDCGDLVDDNGDCLIDCDDPDCSGAARCRCTAAEICNNGVDDDCDGARDCGDSDCQNDSRCACCNGRVSCATPVEVCSDMRTNDCDLEVDCADPDCRGAFACGSTCADADLMSRTGAALVSGATPMTGNELAGSCGGSESDELAYFWTAPATGEYTFDTVGSHFDTVLYVLDGACSGTELACDDDSGGMLASRLTIHLDVGTQILLVVDGYADDMGGFVVNIKTRSEAALCSDLIDNDGDGRLDCADPDCCSDIACIGTASCPRPDAGADAGADGA